MVVALHRHPRFMASHGWADWVDGGRGREPRARYGVRGPESSFLVGASLWWQALGHKVGVRSFPGRSTERWASPLVTKGEGGRWAGCLGLTAGQPSVKDDRIKASCSSPDFVHRLFWFGSQSQAFLSLQSGSGKSHGCLKIEDSRHGNRLGRDRTGRSGQGPGSLGAGVGVGAAWAGLGWAVTGDCDCFLLLFLWGHPPFQSVSVHVHVAAV